MINFPIRTRTVKALVANSVNSIQIDAPKDIMEMHLLINIAVTVGAGAVPAIDGLQKFIKAVSLKDSEGRTLVGVVDTRALVQYNKLIMPNNVRCDILPTSVGTHNLQVDLVLHAGRRADQLFDTTLVFPGQDTNHYMVDITLGTNADFGTGYTSGIMSVEPTIAHIQYDSVLSRTVLFPQGKPATANLVTEKTPLLSSIANLGQEITIPNSRFYLYTILIALNSSNERSDAIISRLAVRFKDIQDYSSFEVSWDAHKAILRRKYSNLSGSDLVGIALIDWSEISGLVDKSGTSRIASGKGFNAFDMEKGEVAIAASTEATGSIIALHHYGVAPV